MRMRLPIFALVVAGLSACGPNYSPDTYNTTAVQQANKVEQGVIVGVRPVGVSAAGTVGTVTGAAAGGIAGAQTGAGPISAITALGGSLVGGLAGSAVEHATADTAAFEYIVRKSNNDLVSVTQKDKTALALGLHVLVIAGNQARIVPDYTVAADLQPKPDTAAAPALVPDKPKPPEAGNGTAPPPEAKLSRAAPAAAGSGAGAPSGAPIVFGAPPSPSPAASAGSAAAFGSSAVHADRGRFARRSTGPPGRQARQLSRVPAMRPPTGPARLQSSVRSRGSTAIGYVRKSCSDHRTLPPGIPSGRACVHAQQAVQPIARMLTAVTHGYI